MADVLLRFVHISDTHYAPPNYDRPPSRFDPRRGVEALVEQVNALATAPDFILHTGDVAYDPYPDIYTEIKQVFSNFKYPLTYIPGNHDHNATLQTALLDVTDVQVPFYRTEMIKGVRFIYLDSNHPDVAPPAGRVSADQIAWLQAQLHADDTTPVVIAVHHPLLKTHVSAWFDEFMMADNGDAVHAVLARATPRLRGVFFGHVHQNITFYRDGIMYSGVNSSWTQFDTLPTDDMQTFNALEADPSFNMVTITTEETYIQRYPYRVDA
jgi:3',5'-cyclic-AMP phosphodiesterase